MCSARRIYDGLNKLWEINGDFSIGLQTIKLASKEVISERKKNIDLIYMNAQKDIGKL